MENPSKSNITTLASESLDASSVLKFHKISKKDIPVISDYLKVSRSRSCDFTVGGILLWADYFSYELAESHNSLFLRGRWPEADAFIYYRPIGSVDPLLADKLIGLTARNLGQKAYLVESQEVSTDSDAHEDPFSESFIIIDDWREYLYNAEKFKGFAGRKMEKKRNHLNFFRNHYPDYEIEEISSANVAELIAFTLAFNATHTEETALFECRSTVETLRDFDSYPYSGIALKVDGHIIGYTFGEIAGDTLVVHVEKGNIAYRGVYQALSSLYCNYVLERCPHLQFINREDDMGSEELRLNKMSYHPDLFIIKKLKELS